MLATDLAASKILIIDDQPSNVFLLESILDDDDHSAYRSLTDSRQALAVFLDYAPDLVLLDLQMPHLNGFEVMQLLRAHVPPGSFLPILVLTADITPQAKQQALAQGASDFVTKPFDPTEINLRIHNLLHTRALHRQLLDHNQVLEDRVRERTQALEATQVEILHRLALAAEYRDDDTGEHTRRVGQMAGEIARVMGLPPAVVDLIRQAAPLHDVGKIAIPDAVLLKPGRLTPDEMAVMHTHTTLGAKMLSGGQFPLLQQAQEIALTHHEHWNGHGYMGLLGDRIPLAGRIVAAADVFDALTHQRVYKPAWPAAEAVAEIERQSGQQFDPAVVAAFGRVIAA